MPWQPAQLASKILLPTSASPLPDDELELEELELEDELELEVEEELELAVELMGLKPTQAVKDSAAKKINR
ncbi:MAG: hypothetical protein U1F46_14690 [Marinagarivorans sp.]